MEVNSAKIRKLLEQKRLTIREASRLMGVREQSVYKLLGRGTAHYTTISKLAEVLSIAPAEISPVVEPFVVSKSEDQDLQSRYIKALGTINELRIKIDELREKLNAISPGK